MLLAMTTLSVIARAVLSPSLRGSPPKVAAEAISITKEVFVRTRRNLAIAVALTLLLSTTAYAGNINTNDAPGDIGSVMYTLNQIYEKVTSGTTPAAKTAGFKEPAVGPAGTMYTLDNIEAKIAAGTTTAAAGDVLDGKTFITRTAGSGESAVTGIAAAGANVSGGNGLLTFPITDGLYSGSKTATANDTNLLEVNIQKDVPIFGVTGTFTGLYGIPKTGAPKVGYVTTPGEDGTAGNTKGTPASGAKYTISADTLTVLDNGTGLTWVRNPISIGGAWAATMTWANAITNCAALNAGAGYGGYTDWRLPNIKELQSIVNYGNVSPAIGETTGGGEEPFTNTQSSYYWSSTTYAAYPDYAWYVSFFYGGVNGVGKTGSSYVRPVRGG